MNNNYQRILIIRLSAIGDIVMASPLVSALKQRYPQATISWLAEPGCHELLEFHPDIDQILVWPKARWKKLRKEGQYRQIFKEFKALKQQLKAAHFDLVLDTQGLLKSAIWAWLSGAPKRIGLGSKEGSQWLMTERLERGGDNRLIGSEYRYLAEQLALPCDTFPMHIGLSDDDKTVAQQLIPDAWQSSGYLALCPFTTRPQKHWITDYWQPLCQQLQQLIGLPMVILGGPDDVDAAAELMNYDDSSLPTLNLVGKTRLRQAAAVIDKATLLIGVDTGLTHMAAAFSTPYVALFGSTCPYLDTGTDSPSKIIYLNLDCSPCRRSPSCEGRFDCLREITPELVSQTANELLIETGGITTQ